MYTDSLNAFGFRPKPKCIWVRPNAFGFEMHLERNTYMPALGTINPVHVPTYFASHPHLVGQQLCWVKALMGDKQRFTVTIVC
jgi:hypothetical protein